MNIIELARSVGASPYTNRNFPDQPYHTFSPEKLQAFANAVIKARDAELIEGAGEPVAWIYDWYTAAGESDNGDEVCDWLSRDYDEAHSPTMGCHNIRPLYTAAQVAGAVAKAKQDEDAPAKVVLQQMKRVATLESTLKVALEALEETTALCINYESVEEKDGHEFTEAKIVIPMGNEAIKKCKEVLHADK